jgi:hypothetical protein
MGGCSDGGKRVQILDRAGGAEHVPVRRRQHRRSASREQPDLRLGRVVGGAMTVRSARRRWQARNEVGPQQGGEPVADPIIQPCAVGEMRFGSDLYPLKALSYPASVSNRTKLIEKPARVFQVGCVKPLREPVVHIIKHFQAFR